MANERVGNSDDLIQKLVAKLKPRDSLSADEVAALRNSVSEVRDYSARKTMVRAGDPLSSSMLLVDGFVARYKDLANGQRQIMEIHVPGDFVDLHGLLLKRLEHNVGALTSVRIALFPHSELKRITETEAHLSRMLWFSTLVDASIQRETIVSVGRRDALARIAHLLCELFVRLQVIGLADEDGFALPLTQSDLSEATGLTSVHVNRMLKTLRDESLLTFRNARVTVHDFERLKRVAEFSDDYLYLERRER